MPRTSPLRRDHSLGASSKLWTEDELARVMREGKIEGKLEDRWWRLNNLYWILDKWGRPVKFRPNWAQKQLYLGLWYLNVILKARQLGMSTFIQILMLDACLFQGNLRTGVVAHHKDDAQYMFRDKIKFAYDNLPAWIKATRKVVRETTEELLFDNNSSIRVSTSMRSGTLQMLHVSEFGKICAKYPQKAREIVTGSFETVAPGQFIFVESTAEGREGRFFDMCQSSKADLDAGKKLGQLDWRFIFLPWWKHPENVLDPTGILIHPYLRKYFAQLETKHGIRLTLGQKAWYAAKIRSLGEDMKREHPSTWEEAFEASVEGAYWQDKITKARQEGRVGKVPHTQGIPVDTWWDLGFNDQTSIWFTQDIGSAVHVIDYYENAGEGLAHYNDMLAEKREELGYRYGTHNWPHDGGAHEFGSGKTRQQQAGDMGLHVIVHKRGDLQDGIDAVRDFLSICWFDEENTDFHIKLEGTDFRTGLGSLENYRKEWDENLGTYKKTPRHDWASHGADGFRTLAMGHHANRVLKKSAAAKEVKKVSAGGWT